MLEVKETLQACQEKGCKVKTVKTSTSSSIDKIWSIYLL